MGEVHQWWEVEARRGTQTLHDNTVETCKHQSLSSLNTLLMIRQMILCNSFRDAYQEMSLSVNTSTRLKEPKAATKEGGREREGKNNQMPCQRRDEGDN